jgi:hypothetical protein
MNNKTINLIYFAGTIMIVLMIVAMLSSCAWVKGVKSMKTDMVGYSGQLDGNYASAMALVEEFGWVSACRGVTVPVPYPTVVIYKCPDNLGDSAQCLIPCKGSYANMCYDNGTVSMPDKNVYFPDMRLKFLDYIEDEIGQKNITYRDKCKGEE